MSDIKAPDPRQIQMVYTNHRGETSVRRLVPIRIWYGKTEFHSTDQWLLEGYDLDRQATRSYALKDIRAMF